ELDPTWGTDYVDATHIREATEDFITYASLNLASINVVEAPHAIADYQRDPASLAAKICEELPEGNASSLGDAIDLPALIDQLMGPGSEASLTEAERAQFASAYRRLMLEMTYAYRKTRNLSGEGLRVLKVDKKGDRAEALLMAPQGFSGSLMKMTLRRSGNVWLLVDVVLLDRDFHLLTELFRPTIRAIKDRRSGIQAAPGLFSKYTQLWSLYEQNSKAALDLANKQLKDDPKNIDVLYVKALCLIATKQRDEGMKILTDLSDGTPPFAPAIQKLADVYRMGSYSKGVDQPIAPDESKKAVELYQRYIRLSPDDPRPYTALGSLYKENGDLTAAEAMYRAETQRDPTDPDGYENLAQVLALQNRYSEVLAAIDAEAEYKQGDMFGSFFNRLLTEKIAIVEGIAAAAPDRMAKSFEANVRLGYMRISDGRPRDAFPLLKRAMALDAKASEPHTTMSEAYRKLHEWRTALT
ncbi:MAG: tetratricopeptide repeat protein, partial [Blastocatellia bacterium]